tara:strand:+ start:2516 stop:3127 length:612 start_codon:yes stop_codon:yes gene_type:complete
MDGATTPQEAYDMMAYQVSEGNLNASNFVKSMMSQFETKGRLSPKQITWAIKLSTEAAHKEADPMAFEDEDEDDGDFIEVLTFMTEVGLTKARLTFVHGAKKVTFSRSPAHGKNPNHIYVKVEGDYVGKITPTGHFVGPYSWSFPYATSIMYDMVAAGVSEYILAYGKHSGICACCGRTLTDERSLTAGVGPVCAKHWNIIWG